MTLQPDRLALLDQIKLDHGSHTDFEQGHCAMEVVAWLADQGHTDAPTCASPVLQRYVIRLNDRWDDERRQTLKPYLPRLVGTGGDGKDPLREQIAARYLCEQLLIPWLRLAGMNTEADQLAAVDSTDLTTVRRLLAQARDAAWALRNDRWKVLRAEVDQRVREHLAGRAVAAADAAADAVAAAVAVADAVADAVAAAAAAAAAVAAAAAAADAAAVAVAVSPNDRYWAVHSAAYKAARAYYDANPLPISQEIADLAASQHDAALDLLDRLIDPQGEAA